MTHTDLIWDALAALIVALIVVTNIARLVPGKKQRVRSEAEKKMDEMLKGWKQ